MSRRRRRDYIGCSVGARDGKLRLRFRWQGRARCRETGLDDTVANRNALEPLAQLVGAAIANGKDPTPVIAESLRHEGGAPIVAPKAAGPTVKDYYEEWIAERRSRVRKAQARDYRRHLEGYVLPTLGTLPLAALKPRDVRGLQGDLLNRVSAKTGGRLSEKYVKNILCGSFAAMLRQARVDELVTADPFVGLEWQRWEHPEPDPLDERERDAILGWFRTHCFSFHAGRNGAPDRMRVHPPYHAYLHFLFWHGARPSEASGLRWKHVDLRRGLAHIRESYHMGRYGKPKTKAARRTIELHPDAVTLLRALQPLRVTPEAAVFVGVEGTPIEPKTMSKHWYDCLRALGIRQRGLYCAKDTFCTLALQRMPDNVPWIEAQTGVRYETLRKHYAAWMPQGHRGVWSRLTPSNCVQDERSVDTIAASG